MRAIAITSFGPPDVLKIVERPMPEPAEGEALVRVKAAGVTRADLLQRQGRYPPPHGASDIPGMEVAGVVEELGANVTRFAVGDAVCAIMTGGGYAEYCVVPSQQAIRIPENWSFAEAATLPENLFTVYDNVVTRAALSQNETILIQGGSSGIGTMAIMLAKLFDATIIVTAGSDQKCQACGDLGAHYAINYKTAPDFAAEVKRMTGGRGADVILDMVGGSYLARNLDALAPEGRLAIIATQGGRMAELDIGLLMNKRARIIGTTMRTRTAAAKGKIAEALEQQIWPELPSKTTIRPIIDACFPLAEASRAHDHLETAHLLGKVLLTVP